MTVRVFRHTDPGAPQLTGVLGSLIAILDACLVNGLTIPDWAATTARTTADVCKPTVSNSKYYRCSTAGTTGGTEPTWPTTTGATVSDGSAVWTCVGDVPTPLGWSKAFSGTNKAAYRMATSGSTGCYLRADDSLNASRTGLTGYVNMTTVDAGTDIFQTVQNYIGICKSATADSTVRPWVLIGDENRFFFCNQPADGVASDWDITYFGDIFSYIPSDNYRCMLAGRYATALTSQSNATSQIMTMNVYQWTTYSAMVMPRAHTGAGASITVGAHSDGFKGGNAATGAYVAGAVGPLAYPNVMGNSLFMAPHYIHQATTSPYVVRGYTPGLWVPHHNRPLANNDTFSGQGALAGKTFEAFFVRNGGQLLIETSDTWS